MLAWTSGARRALGGVEPPRSSRIPESSPRSWGRSGPAQARTHRPSVRRKGIVPRAQLLARLQASRSVPLVTVIAPTGYGKTTLLAQWAAKDRRSFAWLTIDERDNDPTVLLTSIAAALDRVEPLEFRRSSPRWRRSTFARGSRRRFAGCGCDPVLGVAAHGPGAR